MAENFVRDPGAVSDSELVRLTVPDWVREEVEITPALARALQQEPRIWIRARVGQGKALAGRLGDCREFACGCSHSPRGKDPAEFARDGDAAGQLAGGAAEILLYEGTRDLFHTEEFHSGQFEIQDLSSQAVGLLCAPEPGQTWWDACAGEGGKTLHLSDLMGNKGLIWASDRSESRLRVLRKRAARAQVFNFRTVPWDGGCRPPTKTLFDGVLIDAPCTGVGTWHRNPHARWSTTPGDVKELGEIQKRLLLHAAGSLKPRGRLIYAVCTLARSETFAVAEHLDRQMKGYRRLQLQDPLRPDLPCGPQVIYAPQDFAGNGMFIAVWVRERP